MGRLIGNGPTSVRFSPEQQHSVTAIGLAGATAVDLEGAELKQTDRVRFFEDFLGAAGTTLPAPLAKQDTSAAGAPTLDYVASAINGEYKLATDATAEAQNITLYFGDQLVINPLLNPVFETRIKVNFAGAAFSDDQRLVVGLAAARNAVLDSNVAHVWFRIEGASRNILVEADDGTTDTDDQDSTIDIVDDTYLTLRIDLTDTSNIGFYVNGIEQGGAVVSASALAASNKLQPYIELQKDAGTEVEAVSVDYILVEQDRV